MGGKMKWFWVNSFVLLIGVASLVSSQVDDDPGQIQLNGQWMYMNSNKTISGVGNVPGSIYTDLMRDKKLGDPYYRFNDVAYRWVSYDNWTYSRSFNMPAELLGSQHVELWAGGLDTVASIFINDRPVESTNNMFRRYIFNIKPMTHEGKNDIRIEFQSAVQYAKAQSAAYPYMVPPECPPDVQHGECHFNFIRKEAASFSWDWGPAFPTQGIWRNITIRAYDDAVIDYIVTQTVKGRESDSGDWYLRLRTFFRLSADTSGTFSVFIPSLGVKNTMAANITTSDPSFSLEIELLKSQNVEAWWPNGEGDQKLYEMTVVFQSKMQMSAKKINVGFRTVELVEETIDGGLTFFFKINGKPVFMKGSNWIPADAFKERLTHDYLYKLLYSAKAANMNMLRVWGGGIYELETFYELADQLGIMIWQDFMYACALYPTNNDFLKNVQEEVRHQVRRLMRHPSIAVWAGNNENEGALRDDWYHVKEQFQRYYDDYIKLYITTIRTVVLEEDVTRPFVPSSPSNGKETEKEGWVAKNPGDSHYGDVHHYDYTSDGWNWKVFPITRFLSEFGFESWSSFETLQKVSTKEDWVWNGTWAEHRQHHGDGNQQMYMEAAQHLAMPQISDPAKFFEYFTYLTQINQAMSIKTEAELCRRRQSILENGLGYTMGSLYWQLNDIWQAPTWASTEYGGKWKMLQYYARAFYNKTIVSTELDGDNISIYYVEDGIPPFGQTITYDVPHIPKMVVEEKEGNSVFHMEQTAHEPAQQTVSSTYKLLIQVYSWGSLTPVKSWTVDVNVPTRASTVVHTDSVSRMLSQAPGCSTSSCFLYFTMYYDQQMTLPGPSNWQFITYPKDAQGMNKANIQVTGVVKSDNTFTISLATDNIAAFTWLEATGMDGYFSDNGFMMVRPTLTVVFYPWKPDYTADDLKAALKVWSLMDVYSATAGMTNRVQSIFSTKSHVFILYIWACFVLFLAHQ